MIVPVILQTFLRTLLPSEAIRRLEGGWPLERLVLWLVLLAALDPIAESELYQNFNEAAKDSRYAALYEIQSRYYREDKERREREEKMGDIHIESDEQRRQAFDESR